MSPAALVRTVAGAALAAALAGCPQLPQGTIHGVAPPPADALPLKKILCIHDDRFPFGNTAADQAIRAHHLDLVAQLGVTRLRHDLRWADVEPAKGDWHFEGYDAGVAALASRGIDWLAILDYGVPWASSQTATDDRYPPDDPADYAEFAGKVAERYGDRVSAFEIWNEENSGFRFWKPAADPAAYATLLHDASAAIHAARPNATVVYGGLFYLPQVVMGATDFLSQSFAARPDLANDFDAFAFHPYTLYPPSVPPEAGDNGEVPIDEMGANLRAILDANGAKGRPMWATELGWPDFSPVTPMLEAAFLARASIWLAASQVSVACWFTLSDGPNAGQFPPEDSFGLRSWDPATGDAGEAKPAWDAMTTLVHTLGVYRMVGSAKAALGLGGGAYAFLLATANGYGWVHAIWSYDDRYAGEVVVPEPERAEVHAVDALGQPVPLTPVSGGVKVAYGTMPVYVIGKARYPN